MGLLASASGSPNLRKTAIAGHQLVKPDWNRFSPTKAVTGHERKTQSLKNGIEQDHARAHMGFCFLSPPSIIAALILLMITLHARMPLAETCKARWGCACLPLFP